MWGYRRYPHTLTRQERSTYYGYSPADAGQDIRENYSDYIYYDYCLLSDGTYTEAVFDAECND